MFMDFKYRMLISDFDGTLMDNVEIGTRCARRTAAEFGLREPEVHEVRRFPLLSSTELWGRLAAGCPEMLIQQCIQHYDDACRRMLRTDPPLFPGALETVRDLKEAGLRIAVLSNREEGDLRRAVLASGLDRYIDLAAGVGGGTLSKPSATAMELVICPALGSIDPETTLVCGDSPTDLAFARAAALHCCWARYGYGDPSACTGFLPDFTIDDIRQLPSVLRGR